MLVAVNKSSGVHLAVNPSKFGNENKENCMKIPFNMFFVDEVIINPEKNKQTAFKIIRNIFVALINNSGFKATFIITLLSGEKRLIIRMIPA
jgi:hypothetical protein